MIKANAVVVVAVFGLVSCSGSQVTAPPADVGPTPDTRIADSATTPDAADAADASADVADVDLSGPYVELDDFESTYGQGAGQNEIAGALGAEAGFATAGGYWYVFSNSDSQFTTTTGAAIVSADLSAAMCAFGSAPDNFADAIVSNGHPGSSYDVLLHLNGTNYPYAGVFAPFTGIYARDMHDLTKLSAVTFWARGIGTYRAEFVPDATVNHYSATDAWGFPGAVFTVSNDWQQFVIPVSELAFNAYSPQLAAGDTWASVRTLVNGFKFQTDDSYGASADIHLELQVDDIRLYGMALADFATDNVVDVGGDASCEAETSDAAIGN